MKKKNNQPAENAAEETVQAAAQDQPVAENEPAETGEATLEQWQQALETAVAQRDEYLDSLRRTQADFQNFKRRNATARSDGYEEGTREAIAAMCRCAVWRAWNRPRGCSAARCPIWWK